MNLDDFRSILESSGVDIWTFIDSAILLASVDFENELKHRRDKIVEMLYRSSLCSSFGKCMTCDFNMGGINSGQHHVKESDNVDLKERRGRGESGSPSINLRSIDDDNIMDDGDGDGDGDDDEMDPHDGLFDDEQKKILGIKRHLEDPNQSKDSLVELLENLTDMDITFKTLKETDIGRHVNKLRKHPSSDVRRLAKQLVRKWKEIIDEWIKLNPQEDDASSALIVDGDSPQTKSLQSAQHQVSEFPCPPNTHDGSHGWTKNNLEPEQKLKQVRRKEVPPKPPQQLDSISPHASHDLQRQKQQQKENNFDSNKLDFARKRLQENYKEVANAKRQRTVQVMDIHEIPKQKNKNTFFSKSKGGGSHGRNY